MSCEALRTGGADIVLTRQPATRKAVIYPVDDFLECRGITSPNYGHILLDVIPRAVDRFHRDHVLVEHFVDRYLVSRLRAL